MSAVGGAGGGGAGGGGGGGGPNWSQGHGVDSVAGEKGVKKHRTPLYQSGAASVEQNWAGRIEAGSAQQNYGQIDISLVPRRSNPAEFRPIATKRGGGGADGATSFPMRHDHPDAVRLSGGRVLIDRPDSPPPPAAAAVFAPPVQGPPPAAAAAAFVPPVQGPPPAVPAPVFMPPVAAPAQAAPPPAAFAPIPVPARAAAAAPMPAVKGPPRGGGGGGSGGSGKPP